MHSLAQVAAAVIFSGEEFQFQPKYADFLPFKGKSALDCLNRQVPFVWYFLLFFAPVCHFLGIPEQEMQRECLNRPVTKTTAQLPISYNGVRNFIYTVNSGFRRLCFCPVFANTIPRTKGERTI
jgi:hypothetical protein